MSRTDVGDCSSISIPEQFAGSLDLTDEKEKKGHGSNIRQSLQLNLEDKK